MLVVKPDPENELNEIKSLNAFSDNVPCGYIRFHHRGYIIVVDELIPLPEDPKNTDKNTREILDTIIRALGSYGLNHSCYFMECENPMLFDTLREYRFHPQDGMMKSDLSAILTHSHN